MALAERLAHTLKGVAGNIGAKAIQDTAGALEKLIRDRAQASAVAEAKSKLAATLDPLVAALRDFLSRRAEAVVPPPAAQSAPAPAEAVDPAVARGAAAQLVKLISDFDPGAADFVASNRAVLRSLFPGDSWSEFERLIQNYAFAEARARLEQVIPPTP